MTKLKRPTSLNITYQPSAKQYEVWKALQPECPNCGGKIVQQQTGLDRNGQPTYKAKCSKCGTTDIPQLILCGGAAGGGKGELLDAQVVTPFGLRRFGDLKVGDIISNPKTGGQQRVIYLHPISMFPFYRVHFVDGTHIDCTEGHLWPVHKSRNKTKAAKKYGEINSLWSTKMIYDWYQAKKQGINKGYNLIIPLTEPVQFTITGKNKNREIDPYIIGALIGDGSMTTVSKSSVQFTNIDEEIIQRFEQAGYDMSCNRLSHNNNPDTKVRVYNIKDIKLASEIARLGIAGQNSKTLFIPYIYKYAPIKERILLMQGLMDTDGYVDDRGHMSYTTISPQLAEDVAFVVRSLGGIATIKKDKAGYKDDNGQYVQCNDAYTVYFRTKMNPDLCGISRKKERAKYEFNGGVSELGKRIIDCEYLGEKEGRCISVSDSSGLYITNDFTVTHNSHLMSAWLISSCIRFPNIRMAVCRKTLKSLKESTVNTIKVLLRQWGLKEDENYHINNLEGHITFWNDSKIIYIEMTDQPSDSDFNRFGSMELSGVAIDEVSEISEKAVDVLFSRIRYNLENSFQVAKCVMSTNPCLGWVRDRFVQDNDGNPVKCAENERYIPFSVYDNPDVQFRATYLSALDKIADKATRERLKYGNWDFVDTNVMAAYWNFDGDRHLVDNLREKVYDPMKPIVSGWDFNVAPYMSELEFQFDFDNKKVYVLEETLGKPEAKENNTPMLAAKVKNKHLERQHLGGLIITGDPAGAARSTQTEEGVNNYTIIEDNLKNSVLNPRIKLLAKQPPQTTRLEFVNALFKGFNGWEILIDMRCRRLTEDLIYQQKNSDGTKVKKRVLNAKTGGKEEKYGHLSDILDYVCVLFLNQDWKRFQNLGSNTPIISINSQVYTSFEY